MIRNYLKVAIRNFNRQKGFALIMVLGLALGFACTILLSEFIVDAHSYDQFHAKKNRIFRITQSTKNESQQSHLPFVSTQLGPALVEDFPMIEQVVQMGFTAPVRLGFKGNHVIPGGSETWYASSHFFDLFSYSWYSGNPSTALSEPYSIVINKGLAHKLFGTLDPIGQHLEFHTYGRDHQKLEVTGIIENEQPNSHLSFESIISYNTLESINPNKYLNNQDWLARDVFTYVLLRDGASKSQLIKQFPEFLKRRSGSEIARRSTIHVQPVEDIYLYSDHLDSDQAKTGNRQTILIFVLIALTILLVASINYINLVTARSSKRTKEMGIRKSLGALQTQFIVQSLVESILISILAMILALTVVEIIQPVYNSFIQMDLSINYHQSWYILLSFAILLGVISGIYPGVKMSLTKPIDIFKGQFSLGGNRATVRKSLVLVQFTLATLIVIAAGTVWSQINFLHQTDLGLDKEQIVFTSIPSNSSTGNKSFIEELLKEPRILSVGRSAVRPLYDMHASLPATPTRVKIGNQFVEPTTPLRKIEVGAGFAEVFGLNILAGRTFSEIRDTRADNEIGYLINETAMESIGVSSPRDIIGHTVIYDGQKGKIIGVLEDFNFESLHSEILPFIMVYSNHSPMVFIKISDKHISSTIRVIQNIWERHATTVDPFNYNFMSEFYNHIYAKEREFQLLLRIFSIITIFIACIGALGLTAFIIEERKKEISIRKVLGASVSGIFKMLSFDLMKIVILAFLIGGPIGYYVMQKWLQNFAYHIDVPFSIIAAAGILIISISFCTILLTSTKAAVSNPTEYLKRE